MIGGGVGGGVGNPDFGRESRAFSTDSPFSSSSRALCSLCSFALTFLDFPCLLLDFTC